MFKFFTLTLLLSSLLYAETIPYKETRYIDAIGQSVIKKGTLSIDESTITNQYEQSDEKLHYQNNQLFIIKNNHRQEINLEENLPFKIYFELLHAIYLEKENTLLEYFTRAQNNNQVVLTAKSSINRFIKDVHYRKNKRLESLIISFTNNDRITIEPLQ